MSFAGENDNECKFFGYFQKSVRVQLQKYINTATFSQLYHSTQSTQLERIYRVVCDSQCFTGRGQRWCFKCELTYKRVVIKVLIKHAKKLIHHKFYKNNDNGMPDGYTIVEQRHKMISHQTLCNRRGEQISSIQTVHDQKKKLNYC